MPIYEVEKDGKVYEVEAPDQGAALAGMGIAGNAPAGLSGQATGNQPVAPGAQAAPGAAVSPDKPAAPVKLGPEGFKQALSEMPWMDRQIAGIGSSAMLGIQSLQQLLGRAPSESEVNAWKAIAADPHGTAGNIIGNLMALAIPGSKVVEGIRTGSAIPGLAAAGSILPKSLQAAAGATAAASAVPLAAAGEAALLTPTTGNESRAENAAKAALFSKALQVAFKAGGRLLTNPVQSSEVADKLMDQGVQPTVRQGGTGIMGSIVGSMEELAQNLPLVGRWVKKGGERAHGEVMEEAASRATPIGTTNSRPGRGEFFKELDDQFDTAYDALLKGKNVGIPRLFQTQVTKAGSQELNRVPPAMEGQFVRDMGLLFKNRGTNISGETWKEIQTTIRQRQREWAAAFDANKRPEDAAMMRAYEQVEKKLAQVRDRAFNPDEVSQLKLLDDQFANSVILRRGAAQPSEGAKDTSVQNLIKAVESSNTDADLVRGMGRMQDLTDPAKAILQGEAARDAFSRRAAYMTAGLGLGAGGLTLNPALAGVLLSSLAIGKAASTRGGARYMLGGNEWQKRLADALRSRAPAIDAAAAAVGGTSGQRD